MCRQEKLVSKAPCEGREIHDRLSIVVDDRCTFKDMRIMKRLKSLVKDRWPINHEMSRPGIDERCKHIFVTDISCR